MRLYLCLSFLVLAPALLAQRFPEVEPNNTAATANAIAIGTQIDANLVAGENDWYTFTVAAATRVRIHTSNTDTRIALCNAAGTVYLGIDDDARTTTNGFSSEIALNIAAGTYTVQVVGFTSTTTGLYSIEVAELTPVVYDGTEVEPNDTHLTATPTVLAPGGTRYQGNTGPSTQQLSDVTPANVLMLSDTVAPQVTVLSDTVVSSTTTVITATTVMVASAYIGSQYYVSMTSGPNVGLQRLISANTTTTITTAAWPVVNVAGNTYNIVRGSSTTVTQASAALVASAYTGGAFSVLMTSGVNVGLIRVISANTATTITTTAFPVASNGGDTYDIINTSSTTVIRASAALTAGIWAPAVAGFGRFYVRFTSGANAGQYRQITTNTTSLITCSAFAVPPAGGDAFVVELCDVDYYQIVLTAPFTGFWFQINEGDAPWVFGHRYELYDAAGVLLAPVSSTTLPAFGTQAANCSTLSAHTSSARVWPAGTYYIAVRSPTAPFVAATVMPAGIVPNGNYMLELFAMPMDTGGIVAETEAVGGPNSNNTAATAIPFTFGQIGQGNVTISTGADPSDWWGPIVISTPSTITYQARDGASPAMLDSTINLRDSAGNIALAATGGNIWDVSTSTAGLHARVTVTFYLTPGTFYLEVISPGTTVATQSGNYELELSSAIPAPYVAASYATFAANAACGVAPFPALARQFVSEVPSLGNTFARQITNCPAGATYILMQGFSSTTANGGTVPLPFDMTPAGAPGCTLNVDPLVLTVGVANGAGVGDMIYVLPGSVALRGYVLWDQVIVQNPAANALGVQVSNYGRIITGERTY